MVLLSIRSEWDAMSIDGNSKWHGIQWVVLG